MPQSVSGSWDALFAVLQGMFSGAGQLVCAGAPGEYQPDLIVSMMGVRGPITQPTMGTNRSRDKRITIDVVISSYVAGGEEAQQLANQNGWAAADLIEGHFRVSPNERLGGACYNAFAEVEDMDPSVAWERLAGVDDPVPAGRVCTITMQISVWIRL